MKCQKGKLCVKQPGDFTIPKNAKFCTGCDTLGKDVIEVKRPKVGDRVEILRIDISGRPKNRKHWYGRITRISGGECLVRPMWKKWETSLYYPEEITSV